MKNFTVHLNHANLHVSTQLSLFSLAGCGILFGWGPDVGVALFLICFIKFAQNFYMNSLNEFFFFSSSFMNS